MQNNQIEDAVISNLKPKNATVLQELIALKEGCDKEREIIAKEDNSEWYILIKNRFQIFTRLSSSSSSFNILFISYKVGRSMSLFHSFQL